jgi:hypothetical protein
MQRSALQKMAEHLAAVKFNDIRIPSWVDAKTQKPLEWKWGPELRIPTLRVLVSKGWCQLAFPEQELEAAGQVISITPIGKMAINYQEMSV